MATVCLGRWPASWKGWARKILAGTAKLQHLESVNVESKEATLSSLQGKADIRVAIVACTDTCCCITLQSKPGQDWEADMSEQSLPVRLVGLHYDTQEAIRPDRGRRKESSPRRSLQLYRDKQEVIGPEGLHHVWSVLRYWARQERLGNIKQRVIPA